MSYNQTMFKQIPSRNNCNAEQGLKQRLIIKASKSANHITNVQLHIENN